MARMRRESLKSLVTAIKDFYDGPYEEESCREQLDRIDIISKECLADVSLGMADRVIVPMAFRDFISALVEFKCEDFESAVALLGFEVI